MDINNGDHLKTWRYNAMKVYVNFILMSQSEIKYFVPSILGMECKLGKQINDDSISR